MKLRNLSTLVVAILCVGILPRRISAVARIPLRVHLTGALVEIDDNGRKGSLQELQIIIAGEKRTFLLDKIEIVGSVGRTRMTLQQLFPPVIRFVGPNDLLQRLLSPTIAGQPIVIDGLLYVGSRTLFVNKVEDAVGPDAFGKTRLAGTGTTTYRCFDGST